jgi:hypothetical protein
MTGSWNRNKLVVSNFIHQLANVMTILGDLRHYGQILADAHREAVDAVEAALSFAAGVDS